MQQQCWDVTWNKDSWSEGQIAKAGSEVEWGNGHKTSDPMTQSSVNNSFVWGVLLFQIWNVLLRFGIAPGWEHVLVLEHANPMKHAVWIKSLQSNVRTPFAFNKQTGCASIARCCCTNRMWGYKKLQSVGCHSHPSGTKPVIRLFSDGRGYMQLHRSCLEQGFCS